MSKISVVAKPERFRRAGINFTREPTVVDVSKLSADQVEQLRAETGKDGMLAIVDGELSAPEESEKTSKGKGKG